jgi:hypothetical protein
MTQHIEKPKNQWHCRREQRKHRNLVTFVRSQGLITGECHTGFWGMTTCSLAQNILEEFAVSTYCKFWNDDTTTWQHTLDCKLHLSFEIANHTADIIRTVGHTVVNTTDIVWAVILIPFTQHALIQVFSTSHIRYWHLIPIKHLKQTSNFY